jgi:ParB/RepB/Spo0J family partition protein
MFFIHIKEYQLMSAKEQLMTLKPKDIYTVNYDNYREFDERKIDEYVHSIKEAGVINPVLVAKTDGKLTLVDGHHRVEAARRLMREYPHISISIKAIVKTRAAGEPDDPSSTAIQKVVSNIPRKDSLVDRAAGCQLLRDQGKTIRQISDMIGKDRTTVQSYLHFHEMYVKNKETIDPHLETLTETFLCKLGAKFERDQSIDVAALIAKQTAPREKKPKESQPADTILIAAGYSKADAKKICAALRAGGFNLQLNS